MGYITVTEIPSNRASKENIAMLYSRYNWASQFVQGKDVLEVACGAGMGLGYLAQKAKQIIGCDYDANLVKIAKDYYKDRINILQCDAQDLPFEDNAFDVVILFEAIYYIPSAQKFFDECKRVLRKNGALLICTANKDCEGFNPSPFSVKYFSVPELANLFKTNDFEAEFFGNFSAESSSFMDKCKLIARKMAVSLNLMPKTMKGKEKLKRIFYGKLIELPNEIKDVQIENPHFETLNGTLPDYKYKVIYAVGHLK